MDELTLLINGERHTGWQTSMVMRSMEQAPFEFELSLTNEWRSTRHRRIKKGDAVSLYCDNDLLVTGNITSALPDYDATTQALRVEGRSKLIDLVECSLIGTQYNGQRLDQIARAVCKPFGIEVVVTEGTDVGAPFDQARLDDGQSPWEFLDSLAQLRAVRLMGDAQGRLLLTRLSSLQAKTPLVLGKNVRRASGRFEERDRFSEYIIVGKDGGSWTDTASTVHVEGRSRDPNVSRYRPMVIVANDDGTHYDFQRQADWRRNTHYGRGEQIVYTVGGWRGDDGAFWTPNTLVWIDDGYEDLQAWWALVEVRSHASDGGKYSELMVMPPEALELVPLPAKKKKKSEGTWG